MATYIELFLGEKKIKYIEHGGINYLEKKEIMHILDKTPILFGDKKILPGTKITRFGKEGKNVRTLDVIKGFYYEYAGSVELKTEINNCLNKYLIFYVKMNDGFDAGEHLVASFIYINSDLLLNTVRHNVLDIRFLGESEFLEEVLA